MCKPQRAASARPRSAFAPQTSDVHLHIPATSKSRTTTEALRSTTVPSPRTNTHTRSSHSVSTPDNPLRQPAPHAPNPREAPQSPTMSGTPGASMPPAASPGTADSYIIGKNTRPANPTPLSAPQEQQVRDLYYRNVRAKCAPEIEGAPSLHNSPQHPPTFILTPTAAFASCALGRTLTMIYTCRAPRLAMNACMLQYQNQAELDRARSEWFALAEERKAARAEHKRKLEDARGKHKEWWNLDDSGRLMGKRAEEEGGAVRREENRVDQSGVRRGGVWGGT